MRKGRTIFYIVTILVVVVLAFVFNYAFRAENEANADEMATIELWQIDGFEGGKGSRAQFLSDTAKRCFKNQRCYVTVKTMSAEAARENIGNGNLPDIISYPAGFYGIENYINGADFYFKEWCRGGYCLLATDIQADFTDADENNVIINCGKDNLVGVAALLEGFCGATYAEPANAYLNLLNGKYKYLLGTQRDVFRLKTRNVSFKIKPLVKFNDLYQNVSILTKDSSKYVKCNEFVEELVKIDNGIGKLGLIYGDQNDLADEVKPLAEVTFEAVLNCPCSFDYIKSLSNAVENKDINALKKLLK